MPLPLPVPLRRNPPPNALVHDPSTGWLIAAEVAASAPVSSVVPRAVMHAPVTTAAASAGFSEVNAVVESHVTITSRVCGVADGLGVAPVVRGNCGTATVKLLAPTAVTSPVAPKPPNWRAPPVGAPLGRGAGVWFAVWPEPFRPPFPSPNPPWRHARGRSRDCRCRSSGE